MTRLGLPCKKIPTTLRIKTDKDEESNDSNESSMSPSYANAFSALEIAMEGIITYILKKNMQITGNHQMARIVRHNDESVREGYIRNGGKEVKLFTSTLKAFQGRNRILLAQRKHLDDFLRGRTIGRLECGRTQLEISEELGIARSVFSRLWQRFQDDGNVSRCYSTGRPELQRPIRTGIWKLLPKETDRAQHQTCLVSSLQLPVRQIKGRPCTGA
ncbi:uncharacterized protein TNCV_4188811 [Trichonephila clavipes]|nr:uncharacterized protein TNCV_4188811 [Trichonephila clavipes]